MYKGGVARRAFCLEFGFPAEEVRDIDFLPGLSYDHNVGESGSGDFDQQLSVYMNTRDCSINEVLLLEDGTIYYSDDCMKSFEEKVIIIKEETPRAFLRAVRFAARYGFRLDLSRISILTIHRSVEFYDEAIHQWTKSICEGLEDEFLARIQWLWSPHEGDTPLDWREVRASRLSEKKEVDWDQPDRKESPRRSSICRNKQLRRSLRK